MYPIPFKTEKKPRIVNASGMKSMEEILLKFKSTSEETVNELNLNGK